MVGPVFLPALAALMVQGDLPPEVGAFRTAPLASDSAALAGAISGQRLELALRGVGTAIHAEARPAEDGCATLIAASTPGAVGTWTRLLRWHDVAWTGVLPEGRVLVAFYEHEGRLPGDRLVLAPADPAAFRATLTRVSQTCRAEAAEAERVLSGDYTGSRSCYFARHPGLELVETTEPGPQTEPTRAVITVLAHETPEA
ncbi:MAG TPA: hypothetical protein VFS87_02580, partial [Qipengyuania sp.]|nr:hypothetical protein [Qipengyuania sp.]